MEMTPNFQILLGVLPFVFLATFILLRFSVGRDRSGSIIDGIVVWAMISDIASECLGQLRLLGFLPLLLMWSACTLVTLVILRNTPGLTRQKMKAFFRVERSFAFYILAMIAGVTLFIALTAAPNNWDSQAYHLPRIEHWIQNRTLAYYPSWNLRQNEFAPLSELLLLQTRVLSGSDFYYLLIQWIAMLGSIAATFRITRQLGGDRKQCWIAAVFLATLPIGILESTSTQNDYLVALFLMAFVTLGIEAVGQQRPAFGLVLAAGAAGVMTGLVKPIGYMVGFGFALWFAISLCRGVTLKVWLRRIAGIAVVTAILVAPFAVRFVNGAKTDDLEAVHFSSSFGIRQTLDSFIRHWVSNLAVGIPEIDDRVVSLSERVTYRIGLQAHRADTSDPLRPNYTPPVGLFIFHEDLGPNQLHTILLTLACLALAIRWPSRPSGRLLLYGLSWMAGLLIFASLSRFSLWAVRYHLAGFAAGAPLFAMAWPTRWSSMKSKAMLALLALVSIPVLVFNQSRELVPLLRTQFPALGRDRLSYLPQTRLEQQFVNQPQMLAPYQQAIDTIVRSKVTRIGIIMDRDNFEYPLWLMLRDRVNALPLRIEAVAVPGKTDWPLGPFTPEMIFWDKGSEEAPPSLTLGDLEFRRISQSDPLPGHVSRVALYEPTQPKRQ